jgi:hypothetical protein
LDGQSTVDAVGFRFDSERFIIGGLNLRGSRNYRNIAAGNRHVTLIVDGFVGIDLWTVRDLGPRRGRVRHPRWRFRSGDYFVIDPTVAWCWGVGTPAFGEQGAAWHKTVWPSA